MREHIKDLVSILSEFASNGPIYEFGSWQAQPGLSDLRGCFPRKEYIGCDIQEGPGVDCILDVHRTDLPEGTAGTVLMMDVLEHVREPIIALNEIHRILKSDGIVIFSSVMDYPIHDAHDYWRFTPECFEMLLEKFPVKFIADLGDPACPDTVLGVGLREDVPAETGKRIEAAIKAWKEKWVEKRMPAELPEVPGWKRILKLFIPPIALKLFHNLRILLKI